MARSFTLPSTTIADKARQVFGAVPLFGRIGVIAAIFGVAFLVTLFFPKGDPSPKMDTGRKASPTQPTQPTSIEDLRTKLTREQAEFNEEQAKNRELGQQVSQKRDLLDRMMYPNGAASGTPQYENSPQQSQDPVLAQERALQAEMKRRRAMSMFEASVTQSASYKAESSDAEQTGTPDTQTTSATASAPVDTRRKCVIYEGTEIETTLQNRIDSTFSGPVVVKTAHNFWCKDRVHLLLPQGTTIIGNAKSVDALGQKRVAVTFHRIIRNDGYSVTLDQFTGLNQIGETGLRDKVDNHYAQIFGVSIALGIIGAAAQGGASYGLSEGGWDYARRGVGTGISQAGMTTLQRFLNIPPTVTIREGSRVSVYMRQDLEIPEVEVK